MVKTFTVISHSHKISPGYDINESFWQKCERYWPGAQSQLMRQNACAVLFDQNCCKVGFGYSHTKYRCICNKKSGGPPGTDFKLEALRASWRCPPAPPFAENGNTYLFTETGFRAALEMFWSPVQIFQWYFYFKGKFRPLRSEEEWARKTLWIQVFIQPFSLVFTLFSSFLFSSSFIS